MSIVPYNSRNEIVYYDPAKRLVVLHDSEDNTIQLLTSEARFDDFNHLPYPSSQPDHQDRCPHCGSRLNDHQTRGSHYRLDSVSSANRLIQRLGLLKSEFMHDNYFEVLANIPYGNAIGDGLPEALPSDIFNQGYFERFFKKIPPYILGSGAHAQVYKVMHVLKDIQLGVYAVKRISIGDYAIYLDQVLNEVLILYQLSVRGANENNLIRYNHVWMEHGSIKDLDTILLPENRYEAPRGSDKVPYVFILQQYCDGGHIESLIRSNFQRELFMSPKEKLEAERQKRRRRKSSAGVVEPTDSGKTWLSDFEIWKFFKDIANGVHYLHSQGILHRDLKPSNCLLESKYDPSAFEDLSIDSIEDLEAAEEVLPRVLVSDFGEGKFIDKQYLADQSIQIQVDSNSERRGNTGTIEFTDPRLWSYANLDLVDNASTQFGFAESFSYNSDIYSLGMILCYICLGKLPFASYLRDQFDPEQIRADISRWYHELDREKFHNWFLESLSDRKGEMTPIKSDFEFLIFSMLKGDRDSGKLNSAALMKYLGFMREANFLMKSSTHHELAEIILSSADVQESPEDGLEIDLTKQTLDVPLREPSVVQNSEKSAQYKDVIIYVGLIIAAEISVNRSEWRYKYVLELIKFVNIACLAARALIGDRSIQQRVLIFSLTLSALLGLIVASSTVWCTDLDSDASTMRNID